MWNRNHQRKQQNGKTTNSAEYAARTQKPRSAEGMNIPFQEPASEDRISRITGANTAITQNAQR